MFGFLCCTRTSLSYCQVYAKNHKGPDVWRSGKKYATEFAANDVLGGIAFTRPPCKDDC